jgi:hypothetical protein
MPRRSATLLGNRAVWPYTGSASVTHARPLS